MKIKKYAEDDSFADAEAAFTAELQSLSRYACYRVGEREAAKDRIQELYLNLHQRRAGEIKNMRCYLYRALANNCTQHARDKKRLEFVDLSSLSELRADDIVPESFEQEQALISRLLAALPNEQSEVIRLHLHGECTFAEIAEILDTPLPTVKSRYRYGIEHLRKELQKLNFI